MKKCLTISLLYFLFSINLQAEVFHLVLFKLKEGVSKTDESYKQAVFLLNHLPDKIRFISDWDAGENFSKRPIAADYGLMVVFESKSDLEQYLVHPAHVEAANAWKAIADWTIVDFED